MQVDEQGAYAGEFYTFALAGFIRQRGESDACTLGKIDKSPRFTQTSFWRVPLGKKIMIIYEWQREKNGNPNGKKITYDS